MYVTFSTHSDGFYAVTSQRGFGRPSIKGIGGLIDMKNKLTIYLPTKNNVGQDLPIDIVNQYKEELERTLVVNLGGCTTIEGTGSYFSNSKAIIKEKVYLIHSNYSNESEQNVLNVLESLIPIKREMQQESFAYEINNEMFFI